MSNSAFGRLDGDLFGRSLTILAKLVLDEECNLVVANATVRNITVQDTLFVGNIFEEEALEGITFTGNVMVSDGYSITTPQITANVAELDYIREKSTNHGVVIQSNVCMDGQLAVDYISSKTGNLTIMDVNFSNIDVQTVNTEDLCANNIQTSTITPKTANTSVFLDGSLLVSGNVTANSMLILEDIVGIGNIYGEEIIGNTATITSINATSIDEENAGNGLVLKNHIPYQKFGLGRVHLDTPHTFDETMFTKVGLTEKSFESSNTTSNGIIHPSGNTEIAFQAPNVFDVGINYSNAFVRVSCTLAVEIADGNVFGDQILINVHKNENVVVDQFVHTLPSISDNAVHTLSFTDVVDVSPEDTLNLYARGVDNSGNLDAQIQSASTKSYVTFDIQSFESF